MKDLSLCISLSKLCKTNKQTLPLAHGSSSWETWAVFLIPSSWFHLAQIPSCSHQRAPSGRQALPEHNSGWSRDLHLLRTHSGWSSWSCHHHLCVFLLGLGKRKVTMVSTPELINSGTTGKTAGVEVKSVHVCFP